MDGRWIIGMFVVVCLVFSKLTWGEEAVCDERCQDYLVECSSIPYTDTGDIAQCKEERYQTYCPMTCKMCHKCGNTFGMNNTVEVIRDLADRLATLENRLSELEKYEIVRTPSIFAPQISDWTATETCSCACGPGTRTETRSCTYYVDTGEGTYNRYVETKNNDNPCGAVLSQKTSCREKTCFINRLQVEMSGHIGAESGDKITYVAWHGSTNCTISKLCHDKIRNGYVKGWTYIFDDSQSSPSFPLSCPSLCLPQLDSVLTEIEVINRGPDGFLYNTIDMAVNGHISRVYNSGTDLIKYDTRKNIINPSYKKSAYRP